MFDIKSFLLVATLALSTVLSGCGVSTEDLAKEFQSNIEEKFKGEGITVKSFMLSHKGGNEYKGILETNEPNGEFTYAVEVIYDGSMFTWEITD